MNNEGRLCRGKTRLKTLHSKMKKVLMHFAKWTLLAVAFAVVGGWAFRAWWGALALPLGTAALVGAACQLRGASRAASLKKKLGSEAPELHTADGFTFRDLNKNGKLDVYEDARQPVEARVADLLAQMSLEDKAGLMFSPMLGCTAPDQLHKKSGMFTFVTPLEAIAGHGVNTFASLGSAKPAEFAKWYNACQKLAERTRLGIPVTLCSDPRHWFVGENNPLATLLDAGVSAWPVPLGLAAARDLDLIREHGRIARQELRAMGISFALHPSADTATEPRWPRISETFGEDAQLNGQAVAAYVQGFQGQEITAESVACCIKHFPGGGPQKDGDDPHFEFGKDQVYPGGMFRYHLEPFTSGFRAGAAAAMPYYGRPVGLEGVEEVGFNFNEQIVGRLLRHELKFEGIVHTDYNIIVPRGLFGMKNPPRAWGVEALTTRQKLKKAVLAGCDQIGGEYCSELLVELVQSGEIPEARLNESCRRVLRLKFQLGLFDAPYISPERAAQICGKPEFVLAGEQAMRRSVVLLKNERDGKPILPLQGNPKVYLEGFSADAVKKYAQPVKRPQDADFALVRLDVPYRRDTRELLAVMFKGLDLDYPPKTKKHLEKLMKTCPTIVCIKMTRPAVIPELAEQAAGILCEFGIKESIMLEAVFGGFSPSGKLPFELPRSMRAVREQKSDVPCDSKDPLFPYGFGLSYQSL